VTMTAAYLGLRRSIPRCPTWRPIQRRSPEPVGQKGPILRQQTLTQMWSPQFGPDPRILGIGLAFSCATSTAAESSAMTGPCPGSPSPCFSPTAKSASSCSPTHRPCSAHLLDGMRLMLDDLPRHGPAVRGQRAEELDQLERDARRALRRQPLRPLSGFTGLSRCATGSDRGCGKGDAARKPTRTQAGITDFQDVQEAFREATEGI
jgi:hypothetical protein